MGDVMDLWMNGWDETATELRISGKANISYSPRTDIQFSCVFLFLVFLLLFTYGDLSGIDFGFGFIFLW